MRARDHGIVIGQGTPGRDNAITDVPGVRVGHRTLSSGSGPLIVPSGITEDTPGLAEIDATAEAGTCAAIASASW